VRKKSVPSEGSDKARCFNDLKWYQAGNPFVLTFSFAFTLLLPCGYDSGMALALLFFGASFAAFCVWLTVRIVSRRERWAKRTAWALAFPSLYFLSMAPVLWMDLHGFTPAWTHDVPIYWPVQWTRENGPAFIRDAINQYLAIWFP
jgi:hypothetical protein